MRQAPGTVGADTVAGPRPPAVGSGEYLFQKNDLKFRQWAAALQLKGVAAGAVDGSPIRAPFEVLRRLARAKAPAGYVFRYLNDYPSTGKTVLRFLSEASVLLLVKSIGGTVAWIAHNVDRESSRFHPRISAVRRAMVARLSDVILVTDPLLIGTALREWPHARVQWICFGAPPAKPLNQDTLEVRDALRRLREKIRLRFGAQTVRIGLCVSSPSPKCRHFTSICDFVDRFTGTDVATGAVVVGHLDASSDPSLDGVRQQLERHPQIVFFNRAAEIGEEHLASDVDFLYRVLDDQSVPMSAYVAAALRIPLVTESGCFVAELVQEYGLGWVAPSGPISPDALDAALYAWDPRSADAFLQERNWSVAAEALVGALRMARR